MEDQFDDASNSFDETFHLVKNYEKMLDEGQQHFFDVGQVEDIIDFYLEAGEIEKCGGALNMGKSLHPNDHDLLLREAELLNFNQKPDKALELLNLIEPMHSTNADFYITLANTQSQKGKHDKAIKCWRKALQCSGIEADQIYTCMALEYVHLNQLDFASKFLRKAIKINPDSEGTIYEMGFVFEHAGKYKEGIQFFGEFLDDNPYNHHAWYNLGNLYLRSENPTDAIRSYDFALAIKEDFSAAMFNRGNAYFRAERFNESLCDYLQVSLSDFAKSLCFLYSGECCENLDDYENALKYYHHAIEEDPDLSEAYLYSAGIKLKSGKIIEAIQYCQKSVELDSEYSDAWHTLADCYMELIDFEKAIESYQKAKSLDFFNIEVIHDLERAYFLSERFAEGENLLSSAINDHPHDASLWMKQAALLFRTNKREQAVHSFINALETNNDPVDLIREIFPEVSTDLELLEIYDRYLSNES